MEPPTMAVRLRSILAVSIAFPLLALVACAESGGLQVRLRGIARGDGGVALGAGLIQFGRRDHVFREQSLPAREFGFPERE